MRKHDNNESACDPSTCKQDLLDGLLAVLAEAEEEDTQDGQQ